MQENHQAEDESNHNVTKLNIQCKMTTRKIFVVGGEQHSRTQSSTKRNSRKARKSGIFNSSYTGGLHIFTILCCCGVAMSKPASKLPAK